MSELAQLESLIVSARKTNARATDYLVAQLPSRLWTTVIPGTTGKTIQSLSAHLHNTRCSWLRTLGAEHGITQPARVDKATVTRRQLLSALRHSGRAMAELLRLGCERGGTIPPSKRYVWRNLPLDVGHVLTYFSAHEAHHRGQIVMVARQTGCRLPAEVIGGLWQFRVFARETADS